MKSSSLRAARWLRSSALGVSIAVAAVSVPAFAQDATDTTDDSADAPIVVTAQGRAQLLSDVPVAISAVSAEALQNSGANDIRQLNQVAPSLLVSSTGSEANGSARIRGIGTVGDNPGLESSVAVFIDGVYRSRTGSGLNDLGEVDRIEVLRGPAALLYGSGSAAVAFWSLGRAVGQSFRSVEVVSLGSGGGVTEVAGCHRVDPHPFLIIHRRAAHHGHGALRGKPGPVYARLYEAYQAAKLSMSI